MEYDVGKTGLENAELVYDGPNCTDISVNMALINSINFLTRLC